MAQQNEPNHSLDPATVPVKRKRGRPRKEDLPGTEPSGRTHQLRQPVSGILDGAFDAGFLISVRVGNDGPLLRGMVFDSRLCVPISSANDVAPHIKMLKRDEIPIPVSISAEPHQRTVPSLIANKGMLSDSSQGSALKSKGSETVISGMHSTLSKEAAPVTDQVLDNQRQGLSGEPELDITSKASQCSETAGEPKLGPTSHRYPDNEAAGEVKRGCASQSTLGNEVTCQTTPDNETVADLKLGLTSQTPLVNGSVGKSKLDSMGQISPQAHVLSPLSEPNPQEVEILIDSDPVQSSASAAPMEALPLHASFEVLRESKTNLGGNGKSQMPSNDAF